MKRRVVLWAGVLWCALAAASVASAAGMTGETPSPLVLPMSEFAPPPPEEDPGAHQLATRSRSGSVYESVRWRPRHRPRERYRERYREPSGPRSETFSQIHAGFMDPDGREASGLVLGARFGVAVDRHIQIGGQIDWRHRSNSETAVISEGPGPGGSTIITRADLARSSSDLVPILGFVQVSAGDMGVIPYVGAGVGYEVLRLTARDYQSGQDFEGTFGGFGWQAWTGVAMPLSGRSRLNAEVFLNRSEPSRDVTDPSSGQNFRETVNMDGLGMRIGLAWGF